MHIYHQTGHFYNWNIESLVNDKAGDGLIFSPVNIESSKLIKINEKIRNVSFLDPQFYLPKQSKGKLISYDYFPYNLNSGIKTNNFDEIAFKSAQKCIEFQNSSDFKYIVIPTKYFEFIPNDYFEQLNDFFVAPFIEEYNKIGISKKILLTVIVRQEQLMDDVKRNLLLNWITGINHIGGVYLIFENNSNSKQIKDANYLCNALIFIKTLKDNDLDVIIGYTNTEGMLYSIAGPDAITMGTYENLRRFGIKRFTISEKKPQNSPNARLYSGKLYQWIDYGYISAIKKLYKGWNTIFEDSIYKPLMFIPEYKWHFNKSELYRHFFCIYSSQVDKLPKKLDERIEYIKRNLKNGLKIYEDIEQSGVYLDGNSNGEHLNFWLTAISMYEKYLKE